MLPDLVEAVALLPRDLDSQLDLIGGGDQLKVLEQLAQRLQITERVHFWGRVSAEELHRLLSEATVFAMPSIAELQSLATIEG